MGKHLLVTTDDFGMCHSVNLGIEQAMTQGICTATNFLVPCPWFEEAMSIAKRHHFDVGVHLCLTCDWDRLKWRPLTGPSSLTDSHGYLLPRYEILEKQAKDEDMIREYRAQLDQVKSMDWEPSHVESHMLGAQMHGGFYDRVKGIIRQVREEYGLIYTYETKDKKSIHFDGEDYISSRSHDEVFAILESWKDDGLYHLICHAAVDSEELRSLCSDDHPSRDWSAKIRLQDSQFVNDPSVREKIRSLGFELVNITRLKALLPQ